MIDRLADAGAAEQADLPALQVRLEQVDDLDAGLEHLELGRLVLERRRRAMDRPALLRLHRPVGEIDRLAEHVHHPAERAGTDRHLNRAAEIGRLHAALHAVGRLHRDRAHPVLAEVLLHLDDDVDRAGQFRVLGDDPQGVVDFRKVARLELDVDDGADHLDDLADVLFSHSGLSVSYYSAWAPDTTSMISRVMAAWRTLFIYSVRLEIMSAAFLLAVSIAVICAAKNAAFDSSSAR